MRKIFTFLLALSCCIMANATQGALKGRFSVSADKQVYFSQGNLQYHCTEHTWRFAINQWDTIGVSNKLVSDTYNGWIDLFGWGTGNNPTLASSNHADYSPFVDWGVNAISNGGNQPNLWRSLTPDEWTYLFETRANATSLIGKATVGGIRGGVLLPDNWVAPEGISFVSNSAENDENVYTREQWQTMEERGAVFFPATGTGLNGDVIGNEYESSLYGTSNGRFPAFGYSYAFIMTGASGMSYCRRAVRLVQDVTPVKGPLVIPSIEHVSVLVSRDGTELVTGDTVTEGERLSINYRAQAPWYLLGEENIDVVLTVDDFKAEGVFIELPTTDGWRAVTPSAGHISRTTGWCVQMPSYSAGIGTRSNSYTLTGASGQTTVSFIWNVNQGFTNYGKFILTCRVNGEEKAKRDFRYSANPYEQLLYDTISFSATGNDVIQWECNKTDKGNWADNDGRSFYLDSIEINTISGPKNYSYQVPAVKADRDRFVQFEEPKYSTFTATLNGNPFTGGEAKIGDKLDIQYTAKPAIYFLSNGQTKISFSYTLEENHFDPVTSQMVINEPGTDYFLPKIQARYLSANNVELSWNTYNAYDAFELYITTEADPGNPDYWKGVIHTTDSSYIAENLIEGKAYTAYLKASIGDEFTTSWLPCQFTPQDPGDMCTLTIEMEDSYGDGWSGNALVFAENGQETSFTVPSGSEAKGTYTSTGKKLQIIWRRGDYSSECSFRILKSDGLPLLEVATGGATFSDGEVIYEGFICGDACQIIVQDLEYKINSADSTCTISWTAENAQSYDVAIIQKANPSMEELEAIAIPLNDTAYTFPIEQAKAYNAFVRAICPDGQIGSWSNVEFYWQADLVDIMDLFNNAIPIELDYYHNGEILQETEILNDGGDILAVRSLKFSLQDTTDLEMYYYIDNQETGYILLFQDTMAGTEPIRIGTYTTYERITEFEPGDYYAILFTYTTSGAYHTIFRKHGMPTAKVIEPNYKETSTFEGAYECPEFFYPDSYEKVYTYTPQEDTEAQFSMLASGPYKSAGYMIFKDGNTSSYLFGKYAGSACTTTYEKGHTYDFYVFLFGTDGGQLTDTYTISLDTTVISTSTPAIPISPDTVIVDSVRAGDWVGEIGYPGKVYTYTPTRDTELSYSIASTIQTPSQIYVDIYLDTITNSSSYSSITAAKSYYNTFSVDSGKPVYFVVDGISEEFDFTLMVREVVEYNNIPVSDTIQVGEVKDGEISIYQDGFVTYDGYSADYKAFNVFLEKDKKYILMSYTPEFEYNKITVFNPSDTITSNTYDDNYLANTTEYSEEYQNFLKFTADSTAYYTVVLDVYTLYNTPKENNAPFRFIVKEMTDFAELVHSDAAHVVETTPYAAQETEGQLLTVEKFGVTGFHNSDSFTDKNAAFTSSAYYITLQPEDTLYVEAAGSENLQIYIYDTDGGGATPSVTDEVSYAYPAEQASFVNSASVEHRICIVVTCAKPTFDPVNYIVRISKHQVELEPILVTAEADKDKVTVNKADGLEAIRAQLALINLQAVDADNNLVTTFTNLDYLWIIDLNENKAFYELNDSDLPLGYRFFGGVAMVEVNIELLSEGIEDIDMPEGMKPYKFIRDGHIYIRTPFGLFDATGRRVQ